MVSLKDLQDVGAVSSSYKIVPMEGVRYITQSQLESMSEEEKARFDGVVILDNAQWVATIGRKPVAVSKIIVSWNGDYFSSWHKEQRNFFVQELTKNNELATIKQIKLSRDNVLKGGSADMAQSLNVGELNNLDIESMTAGVATQAPEVATNDSGKAPSKAEIATNEIKQMISKTSTVNLGDRAAVVLFNQQYGRSFGFICRTDKAIKLSKSSRPKMVDGKPVWKEGTPQEVINKYNTEGKGGTSHMEKEQYLVWKEAKPSAPIAMIIGTPEGGDVDLTALSSGEVLQPDRSKTSLKFHVLPMETAYIVLAAHYDGKIKEDDTVLGSKATILSMKSVASKKDSAENGSILVVRNSLTINKKLTGSRTTVLTSGNYVPLREYETIPVSAISSEEDVKSLNLNFEAALKGKKVEADFPSNAGTIKQQPDGTVTSSYFSVGGSDLTLFGNIAKFDSKTETVSSIEIPVREKTPTKKDPAKFTYKYKFRDWDSVKTRKDVAAILNSIGYEADAFKAEADKCTRRASTSKKQKNQLSADDILKLQYDSYQIKQGNKDDIRSIAQKLAGIE